jgi:hypothetical protein
MREPTTAQAVEAFDEARHEIRLTNGMDAPTRNGTDVPKWKCHSNHMIEGSIHHEDYGSGANSRFGRDASYKYGYLID